MSALRMVEDFKKEESKNMGKYMEQIMTTSLKKYEVVYNSFKKFFNKDNLTECLNKKADNTTID